MKNGNDRQYPVIRRSSLILVGAFIIATLVVAAPVYSVRSSSLSTGSAQASFPSGVPAKVSQIGSLTASNPTIRAPWSSTFRSLLPVPQSSPETIDIYAADCTTPKTTFLLGEAVCAQTVFVSELDRFVNWLPPTGGPIFGGNITTSLPQNFVFTPTMVGAWKATIADPSDSSINPNYFTVISPSQNLSTYAANCTTPQSDFNLGATVCVKVTGVPLGDGDFAVMRLNWVSRAGTVVHTNDITTDPQTFTFALPATNTTVFTDPDGLPITVDNRGAWKVTVNSLADNGLQAIQVFDVHAAAPTVDLVVSQDVGFQGSEVGSGSGGVFELTVANNGPDAAQTVVLTDTIPANTTFSSVTQNSGPAFDCHAPSGGTFTCTIATLAEGATASFTFAYDVNAGTPVNTIISNNVSVSSATTELETGSDSSTLSAVVPGTSGAETCTLNCHANFSVVADTTYLGNPGAFVTFNATSVIGNCGAITSTFTGLPVDQPASGAFYPVGTTVVHVTSETGGGSCSFTITVVEGTPPTITCPPDKQATATSVGGTATVAVGLPVTNPATDVTVIGRRSDDSPAVYDDNGNLVTPEVIVPLTDPYPVGVTGIDWTVTDSNGLAATCTQRILVFDPCATDTGPPTITAPPAVTVSTGPNSTTCGVALSPSDDELGTPVAHDDCTVVVTSTGIPAGNLFPIGVTTITYTATDGAGHTASATQTVTVIDNTPPVIVAPANASYVCPSEVPAASASQAHGNNPNLPNGGPVFDNCGSPTVTVSDSSTGAGSAASPRIITRTYTATDAHGNSASAVQIITVIDPIPPTFTFVPAAVTAFTGPGATICGTTVSDAALGTATATDNCSVTVTRTGVPAGNIFPKGNTTVTYTATDGAGNTAIATQIVTVIDDTPPTISCLADIIVDFNPAVNGATVNYTAPVGTDNCPGATTAQTAGLASGSVFPLGTTVNTFTVTDNALPVHNTASCSFKVTVALTSIVGLDSVTITGSGYADSYSSAGGYPATKGSLANILSNGTITIGNSGKVWGNVRSTRAGVVMSGSAQVTGNATAGTTVTTSGSASVGGTRTNGALVAAMALPSVPACSPFSSNSGISGTYTYNAGTGDLTLSGVNIATLANGNYCFHNVTLGNSGQLKVNGLVVIKMTGVLNTSGSTNLNNTTQIPSNLRILSSYSGSNGVVLGNSVSIYALIYAPNTGVNLSGSAPLFGTAAAKTITIGNSGAIHYDTQLKSVWPAVWTLIFGP